MVYTRSVVICCAVPCVCVCVECTSMCHVSSCYLFTGSKVKSFLILYLFWVTWRQMHLSSISLLSQLSLVIPNSSVERTNWLCVSIDYKVNIYQPSFLRSLPFPTNSTHLHYRWKVKACVGQQVWIVEPIIKFWKWIRSYLKRMCLNFLVPFQHRHPNIN